MSSYLGLAQFGAGAPKPAMVTAHPTEGLLQNNIQDVQEEH